MTSVNGIIFDCDGVLADTEKFGHLTAFNLAFKQLNLPIKWSVDEYAILLEIGGGKERLKSLFSDNGSLAETHWNESEDLRNNLIAKIHQQKTKNYIDIVEKGEIPARPGVKRLVSEAVQNGWKLGVASTSSEISVRAILNHVLGSELSLNFSVFAGDVVAKKKPAPDIYQLAISKGEFNLNRTIAIEDSGIGCRSAISAGLKCLVTISTFTANDDFTDAALVVSSLGETGMDASQVIKNPAQINLRDAVYIETIEQIINSNWRK